MDWGAGSYEHTATQLAPAAEVAVGHLAPQPGERIVDLGCGTGNAMVLVGRAGASALGVDPSPRLVAVARAAATAAGIDAEAAVGDAAAIPAGDESAEAIVSVFGVIFASDATTAAAEMSRVLRPGGRIVLTAWEPRGVLAEQMAMRRTAVSDLLAEPPSPPPFAWNEPTALEDLLGPLGFSVVVHPHRLPFRGTSPQAYVHEQMATHPMWLETRALAEPAGRWDDLRDRIIELFTEANEDPAAFQVTSDYVTVVATSGPAGHT